MKVLISCATFFLLCTSLLFAQSEKSENQHTFVGQHHQNISVELLGSHVLAGLNYDRRFYSNRMDGIGFRVGIGGVSVTGQSQGNNVDIGIVTFPLEFNHLIGKRRSSLVSGIGILPAYAAVEEDGPITNNDFVRAEGFGIAGGFLTFGYRLQPLKTGFMMQINWNPMIFRGSGFNMGWIGISMGMGFKG